MKENENEQIKDARHQIDKRRTPVCNAPTGGVWPDVGEGGLTTR